MNDHGSPTTVYIPNDALGITEEQAQERISKAGEGWKHFTPQFVGTQVQSLDLQQLERELQQQQIIYRDARLGQCEGKVVFASQLPILIVTLGDIHYGSVFCNYEQLKADLELIHQTPNVYVVFMSNLIDNAIPSQFPSNMLNNVTTPDKQVVAMRKIAEELNSQGKLIGAVTSPCHEGWTWKHTGQDINALIYGFDGRKFPVLDNGGLLKLQLPSVTYLMALYHQVGPFNSNFNHTHATKQMQRLNLNGEADIIAAGHHHVGEADITYDGTGENRRSVVYLRTGTYKGTGPLHDSFSVNKYGTTGEPSGQAVMLWPNERRMLPFLDLKTAIAVHKAVCLAILGKAID